MFESRHPIAGEDHGGGREAQHGQGNDQEGEVVQELGRDHSVNQHLNEEGDERGQKRQDRGAPCWVKPALLPARSGPIPNDLTRGQPDPRAVYWSARASSGEMRAARCDGSRQATGTTAPRMRRSRRGSPGAAAAPERGSPCMARPVSQAPTIRAPCPGQQAQPERDELAADLLGPRAQGHAQGDLAAPLGHGVAQHAIGADGGEQQRPCPRRGPPATRASGGRPGCRAMRASMDRRSFTGSSGSIRADDLLQRDPEGFRGQAGAGDHEERVVGSVAERIVDRALGFVVGELGLLHRAHDADDGEGLGVRPFLEPWKRRWPMAPPRGPVAAREVLVDDADALGATGIGRVEEPSLAQREAQGGEVVAADAVGVVAVGRLARLAACAPRWWPRSCCCCRSRARWWPRPRPARPGSRPSSCIEPLG